jgi:F420H(2)-dependent quinone reductase
VLASNAGSDRPPAWWLNLQAQPVAEVLADRVHYKVRARAADPTQDDALWGQFARLNPGFDEYRNPTERKLPVVLLEPITNPDQAAWPPASEHTSGPSEDPEHPS